MSQNADLIKLYSQKILQLAANIGQTEPLTNPDAVASRRSPLCGSNIKVELQLDGDKIADYSHDVKACALGQAAASIIGANVIGCSEKEIRTARDQLFAMLTAQGPIPDAPFDALEVLISAREFKNRHASIMLCLEAILDGFEIARKNRA